MPQRRIPANRKTPKQDRLSAKVVRDAAHPPEVVVVGGLAGKGSGRGRLRIYQSLDLMEYVEFNERDVLHIEKIDNPGSRLEATLVWVSKGARMDHTRAAARELQSEFLGGEVMATLLFGPGSVAALSALSRGGTLQEVPDAKTHDFVVSCYNHVSNDLPCGPR